MDNLGLPDLSGMIGNMLSDPETLKNILNVAAGLKSAGLFDGASSPFSSSNATKPPAPDGRGQAYGQADGAYTEERNKDVPERGDGGQGSSGVARDDPAAPPLHMPPYPLPTPALPQGQGGEMDDRRRLLLALRPYLSRERQEKMDSILQIFAFLELARRFGGLFGGERGREGGA